MSLKPPRRLGDATRPNRRPQVPRGARELRPFKFRLRPRPRQQPGRRPQPEAQEGEPFTGIVLGKEASELEERFARGLDWARDRGLIEGYDFRVIYVAPRNLTGSIELDFMVYAGIDQPVQIDGNWIHKAVAQREEDELRDAQLNELLMPQGKRPVVRVKGHEIETPEETRERIQLLL